MGPVFTAHWRLGSQLDVAVAGPVAVERLDLKRGFCFVFLKDVATQEEKERAEAYVSQINGMYVPNILP